MNTITRTVEWTAAQACGDCGTDAAFIRRADGAAICCECEHEHPMNAWDLGADEEFTWVGGDHDGWDAVLFVTAYSPIDEAS